MIQIYDTNKGKTLLRFSLYLYVIYCHRTKSPHRTNTSVILNVKRSETCEGSFLRSKIYLRKNEGNSHYRNVDAATLFKVGATIGRPLRMTG